MTTDPLRVDPEALTWDPANVVVPDVPAVPPGADPMSTMVSAFLPTLPADLNNKVAATQAAEQQFVDSLSAAKGNYQNSDDAGQQSIQQASARNDAAYAPAASASSGGAPGAGGQSSQFGQLMSTAMQAAGQVVQLPMQAAQMAGAIPQTAMQIAQQVGQLGGGADKGASDKGANASAASHTGGGAPDAQASNASDHDQAHDAAREQNQHERDEKRDHADTSGEDKVSSGRHAAERAPVEPSPHSPVSTGPGRHAADRAVDM
ncbi:MAG: PE domain-containing protein [Mycobacterium sp.]